MTFEELLKINYGVPFSSLDCDILRVIDDDYYKIGEHKYIVAYEAENLGEIIYCGFVWVASDSVAEWIFTGNSLAADAVNIVPPKFLLPKAGITNYQSLIEYGKKTDPENFSDRVIGQCQVSFHDFTYYFRKAMPSENDFPIAVKVDLRPWKNLKAA